MSMMLLSFQLLFFNSFYVEKCLRKSLVNVFFRIINTHALINDIYENRHADASMHNIRPFFLI